MQYKDNKQKLTFEWDKGNNTKSWEKHKVMNIEAEQIFFNDPLVIKKDLKHSKSEERFHALGKTDTKRFLFITFTTRSTKLRIISARPMDKNERKYYEKTT